MGKKKEWNIKCDTRGYEKEISDIAQKLNIRPLTAGLLYSRELLSNDMVTAKSLSVYQKSVDIFSRSFSACRYGQGGRKNFSRN